MPVTRSKIDADAPRTHVLNFFRDKQNGCGLIALINDVRFHIVIDPAELKGGDGSVHQKYMELLPALKDKEHEGSDSGVDLSLDAFGGSAAQTELQNWILSCFGDEVSKLAPTPTKEKSMTLEEWYNVPVHFYELEIRDSQLRPKSVKEHPEYRKRIDDLFPSLPLPKALRELEFDKILPSDLTVMATSDEIAPIHPSTVNINKGSKLAFFKPVDPTQPQPTKREIMHHHKIQKLGLQNKFNVPELLGLVPAMNSKVNIMGIVLSLIEDPTPLTKLFDSEVDESKRRRWAKESERIVKVLHEHDIIWGDAKADNFMVDKHDELWIIDFGGSYTEGWVDPDNMETKEGDDEAVEKVLNALRDPDGATVDFEEDEKERERERKRREQVEQETSQENASDGGLDVDAGDSKIENGECAGSHHSRKTASTVAVDEENSKDGTPSRESNPHHSSRKRKRVESEDDTWRQAAEPESKTAKSKEF